jgi:hypothetical protein
LSISITIGRAAKPVAGGALPLMAKAGVAIAAASMDMARRISKLSRRACGLVNLALESIDSEGPVVVWGEK